MNENTETTIEDTTENWESRALGADEHFVRVASPEEDAELEKALSSSPARPAK